MTIFFEVAYDLINELIETTKIKSTGLDTSVGNKVVTYAGTTALGHQFFNMLGMSAGRDQELGKIKRSRIEQLLPKIQEISSDACDKQTLDSLIRLITHCRNDTEQASLSHVQSNGITERAMDNLVILLRDIFDKLESLQLLNTPHDKDPLNSFRYHVALYHRRKIALSKEDPSLFEPLYHAQKITFARQQESLVSKALQKCTDALTSLEKHMSIDDPEYLAIRLDHISLSIMRLGLQNDQLISQFTGFLGGSPNDGLLEKCVRDAEAEITKQPGTNSGTGLPKPLAASTETPPPKSLAASTETPPPKLLVASAEAHPPEALAARAETPPPEDDANSERSVPIQADEELEVAKQSSGLPEQVIGSKLLAHAELLIGGAEPVATSRSPLPAPSTKGKKGKAPVLPKPAVLDGAGTTIRP